MPEKTIQTLGLEVKHDPAVDPKDSRTSDELQGQVERRQDLLRQDIDTLKARLKPKRLSLTNEIIQHPLRLLCIAAMIVFYGAEFTKAFADHYHGTVAAGKHAVKLHQGVKNTPH